MDPVIVEQEIGALKSRVKALEVRLPARIPVVKPLDQPRCRDCGMQLATVRDGFGEAFTCVRCDDQEPASLAPTPDYSSERPAEVESCSCEEAEQLRAELGAASVELRQLAAECDRLRAAVPFPDDPDRVATLARKLASETESYQRALKAECAKREAVESELDAFRSARDTHEQNWLTAVDRAEKAESQVHDSEMAARTAIKQLEKAESEVARLREELGRERAAKGIAEHEHRLALGSERKQLKAAESRVRELEAENTKLISEHDALHELARDRSDQLAAANALADLWDHQASEYPPSEIGRAAAAAVTCCARELRSRLSDLPAAPCRRCSNNVCSEHQPTPPTDHDRAAPSVQELVRRDISTRERIGIERYGTALYLHNGRNAIRDAYEEALDLAMYLRQALAEALPTEEQPEPTILGGK